jgi:hypothetical protein
MFEVHTPRLPVHKATLAPRFFIFAIERRDIAPKPDRWRAEACMRTAPLMHREAKPRKSMSIPCCWKTWNLWLATAMQQRAADWGPCHAVYAV